MSTPYTTGYFINKLYGSKDFHPLEKFIKRVMNKFRRNPIGGFSQNNFLPPSPRASPNPNLFCHSDEIAGRVQTPIMRRIFTSDRARRDAAAARRMKLCTSHLA